MFDVRYNVEGWDLADDYNEEHRLAFAEACQDHEKEPLKHLEDAEVCVFCGDDYHTESTKYCSANHWTKEDRKKEKEKQAGLFTFNELQNVLNEPNEILKNMSYNIDYGKSEPVAVQWFKCNPDKQEKNEYAGINEFPSYVYDELWYDISKNTKKINLPYFTSRKFYEAKFKETEQDADS